MILITGGAFQGKTEYTKTNFSFSDNDILDGEGCTYNDVFSCKCVKNYHQLIKRLLSEKINALQFTERLCRENPNAVVIINEIGCGIIPLEKNDRLWREETGRAGCIIANSASAVIRISCGIPTVIKGELR